MDSHTDRFLAIMPGKHTEKDEKHKNATDTCFHISRHHHADQVLQSFAGSPDHLLMDQ